MSRLAGFSGREVGRVAELNGWTWFRAKGSHRTYRKVGVRLNLSIPVHNPLAEGILRTLLKTMDMTVDEFLAVARK